MFEEKFNRLFDNRMYHRDTKAVVIDYANAEIGNGIEKLKTEIVECDKCGCLLWKNKAHKGKSTVEKISFSQGFLQLLAQSNCPSPISRYKEITEQIVEHYFCKIHIPKK